MMCVGSLKAERSHTVPSPPRRDDLSSLPFTTMCIRESLRLHSPVQAVTRKYTQDLALPGGCTVPTGERDWKLLGGS